MILARKRKILQQSRIEEHVAVHTYAVKRKKAKESEQNSGRKVKRSADYEATVNQKSKLNGRVAVPLGNWYRCTDIEFKPVDFCVSNNPGRASAQGTTRNQAYSTQRTFL